MKTESVSVSTNGDIARRVIEAGPMSDSEPEIQDASLNFNDILFVLFRHKWKILLCTAIGVGTAAAIYFLFPALYESEAKLLVRYVVESSAIDKLDSATVKTPGISENLINSEVEILTSSDVAAQVAEAVGVEKLIQASDRKAARDEADLANRAARRIILGLTVTAPKGSNIISVSYRNKDPKLAVQVLQDLVTRYFDKHLEVHRAAGAFDFVTRQAEQLQAQLNHTEQDLKQLKAKAGVTSLAADTAALAAELAKGREELDGAEAELAGQKARVREIEKSEAGIETSRSENALPRVNGETIDEYRALLSRIAHLREIETELLSKYTPENRIVKVKQAQIAELERQRRNLVKTNPGLVAAVPATASSETSRPDLISERARLTAVEAKTETIKSRLGALQERAKTLAEFGPQITQLELTKDLEEANYKYYGATLEKARIDETLDPSRMPNISVVQKPSPALKATRDVKKFVFGLAGGGLALGIGIALMIELVLDRTVKRSLELEKRLRIPLLLSIPNFASNGPRLRLHNAGGNSESALLEGAQLNIDPLESGELLRPFCEAIRDRLYFELSRMTHKPKLVAVTGLSRNAGASTLAAGLSATFSEAGDGKVLLVNKPVAPKRFYSLMEQFRVSEFEYVIFDMPSLGDTNTTLPMAGFMDKVLLVVEAEKSNRDVVKRAYAQLAAKTKVSVVFNKSRSYGPKWLEGEI